MRSRYYHVKARDTWCLADELNKLAETINRKNGEEIVETIYIGEQTSPCKAIVRTVEKYYYVGG